MKLFETSVDPARVENFPTGVMKVSIIRIRVVVMEVIMAKARAKRTTQVQE